MSRALDSIGRRFGVGAYRDESAFLSLVKSTTRVTDKRHENGALRCFDSRNR
jgi:hypothetical protein